jgi:BTB/POZ domain/BTB And C-terminal Kelch
MMETKLKEGEAKKAVIDDINSRALKEFLRFLYCGRVNDIEPIAVELMYAAEKYDIKDLKPLCTESLTKNISVKNAIETFVLADLHHEEDLKIYSLDFILWNYKELKDHESWENVSKALMKEILDKSTEEVKTEKIIKLNSTINPPAPTTITTRQAVAPVRLVANNANVAAAAAARPAVAQNINAAANNLANANAIINQLARAALN